MRVALPWRPGAERGRRDAAAGLGVWPGPAGAPARHPPGYGSTRGKAGGSSGWRPGPGPGLCSQRDLGLAGPPWGASPLPSRALKPP